MKRVLFISGAVLAIVLSACEKQMEQTTVSADTITLDAFFAADTKTALDGLSCTWTDGDVVVVNGETSTGVEVLDGGKAARFTFPIIDAPYYGIYPASAYVASSFDPDNDKYGSVVVPSLQNYVAGSFDPEAAIMVGVQQEEGKGIAFNHAMAYLKLVISGSDSEAIAQVQVWANASENLSGTFTFDPEGLRISEDRYNGNAVTVECGAGAPQGQPIVIAIPAKVYSEGLSIRIKDVSNHYQILKSTNVFTAEAGKIYPSDITFAPTGTLIDGGIYTVSDWAAVAQAITNGDDFYGKTIKLMNDLEVATYFPYANGRFNGTFDGNGHKLTANANIWPLFAEIGIDGTVKDVTFYGAFGNPANQPIAGNATIAKLNYGLIKDCVNYSTTELEIGGGLVFGTICAQNGGEVKGCKNYGDITIHHTPATTVGLYGGGIAAVGHIIKGGATATTLDVDEECTPGTFTNCENHGNIYVEGKGSSFTIRNAVGGICGLVYMNGVIFNGCKNTGSISRISNGEGSSNKAATIGGILGRSCAWYTVSPGDSGALDNGGVNGFNTQIINCSNSGAIKVFCRHSGGVTNNGSGARGDFAAGIVGAIIGKGANVSSVSGCTNTGSIEGGWTAMDVNSTCLGGIAGLANATTFTSCTSECNLSSTGSYAIGAAGGIVAFALADVSLSGCNAKSTIDVKQGYKDATKRHCMPGLAIGNVVTSASFSNCKVGGSISVDNSSLGVNSSNYKSFVVSSYPTSSKTSPDATSVTWF
ncbi:MAG: fimbrillin family protein [Bacteroidales bacterium]|nr:fimbrillin family protein [Bacteroidales bacterium]